MRDEIFKHFSDLLTKELDESYMFRIEMYNLDEETNYTFETADAYCSSGATRMAIIDENYDWIIKFARSEDNRCQDLCEVEEDIYNAAVASGIEQCFARPIYLGKFSYSWDGAPINSVAYQVAYDGDSVDEAEAYFREKYGVEKNTLSAYLYAYPKANLDGYNFTASKQSLDRVKEKNKSPLTERYDKIGAMFLEQYGDEVYETLSEFCIWEEINDIHCGNIGFIDGKIILIDYAGYHDGDSDSYFDEDNRDYEKY